MQNVNERPARGSLLEQTLHFGLCVTQRQPQLLDFLELRDYVRTLFDHSSVSASICSVSLTGAPFSVSSPSSSGTTRATAVTTSPSSRLTSLTPCAIRPVTLT